MATVTHYIRSHYDPKDREALEIATGQVPSGRDRELEDEEADLAWQTESAFGARQRLANAPRFVPAVISYDEINNMIGMPKHLFAPPEPKAEVGSWYKSLRRQADDRQPGPSTLTPTPRASTAPIEARFATPASSSVTSIDPPAPAKEPARPDKNNWFIARALRSEPASKPSSPAPTLADILAREPPAASADKAVKPPVFLALGPSNRGWSLLQQQGWMEGEGIGATAPRRAKAPPPKPPNIASHKKGKQVDRSGVKQEEQEIQLDSDGEITEVRKVEVVDLTLSDSEEDASGEDDQDEIESTRSSPMPSSAPPDASDAHAKPLLTPIATVLKTDRLGIGLKAKTVGPHKASKKRITHGQAALAAHAREAEELRRIKALVGRGSRGFARLAKADSEHRRQLLASLNSS